MIKIKDKIITIKGKKFRFPYCSDVGYSVGFKIKDKKKKEPPRDNDGTSYAEQY